MNIKDLVEYDIINYKQPAMFIAFGTCSFKCGADICQNHPLLNRPSIQITKEELCERYINNPITTSVVMGGLEPFDSEFDVWGFIDTLRRQYKCNDTIVIYTGYTEEEMKTGHFGHGTPEAQRSLWKALCQYKNIIVKFGRFIPNQASHIDEILGVKLASPNQYAKVVSNDQNK